jgi:hypothetical protein
MMSKFEFIGRQVAEGRMPPLAIVEQFDVFEDFASCLGSGVPLALIAQFEFSVFMFKPKEGRAVALSVWCEPFLHFLVYSHVS